MEQGNFVDSGGGKFGQISSPKELILMHLNRISSFIFSGEATATINERGENITKSSDKRETLILAIDFLDSILIAYSDNILNECRNKFLDDVSDCEMQLCFDSINSEAYKKAGKSTDFYRAYEQWKIKLRKDNSLFIEKTSSAYEFYLCSKYSLYMNYFQELNKMLFRKKWLVVEDYVEEDE